MTRTTVAILALLILISAAPGPALAHKLKVFAVTEGAEVSGQAYFSGGDPAQGIPVTATDETGKPIFSGTTDSEGRFRFGVDRPTGISIQADSGDGHAARFSIGKADIAPPPVTAPSGGSDPNIRAYIDTAVARQVNPLRRDVEAWRDQILWRDVIGGLGYILGLGGLAFGLSARKKKGP
jgi:hypothetical protein